MTVQDLFHLLVVVSHEVYRELGRRGQQHSCIVGSEVMLRVLHLLGYTEAFPMTVAVQVWNPAYKRWFAEHGDPEGNSEAVAACNAAGGLRIFVGKGPVEIVDASKWDGHLVVIVPNAFGEWHALLDLTIVQANRPEWEVVLQPMCLKVRSAFVTGESFVGEQNGCMFAYKPFPEDESYKDSPAYTITEGLDAAATAVIGKLQQLRL